MTKHLNVMSLILIKDKIPPEVRSKFKNDFYIPTIYLFYKQIPRGALALLAFPYKSAFGINERYTGAKQNFRYFNC